MNDREFYVQLMSNASTNEFPANKANSFKNRLPYPLVFDGSWKVGLVGVTYPTPPARHHQAHPFASDELICRFEYTEIGILKQANDNRNVIVRPRYTLEIKGEDLNRDQAKVTGGRSLLMYIYQRIRGFMSSKTESRYESLRSDSDENLDQIVFQYVIPVLILTDPFHVVSQLALKNQHGTFPIS